MSKLSGLVNIGNTCYINSTIQCLINTRVLNRFFDVKYEKLVKNPNDYNAIFTHEFNDLRKLMHSKDCIVNPKRFIAVIQKISSIQNRPEFSGYLQNDVGEFIQYFIEVIHNSIKRKVSFSIKGEVKNDKDKIANECFKAQKRFFENEYSEIINIFYGTMITQIISKEKPEDNNLICEPFSTLILPIPDIKEISLKNCFDEYLKNEKINDIKEKLVKFWSLPDILIIVFNRFAFDGSKKNQKLINVPITNIDLSEFVLEYNNESIYDLYATCEHSGNIQGGHYTAHIKKDNGHWYNVNDNVLQKINPDKIITQKTYILFLEKKGVNI